MSEVKKTRSAIKTRRGRAAAPTRAEIRGLAIKLLHEICGIPVETVTDDASVDDELQMESIQLVDLQVAIEHELDVTVDLITVLDLNSFGRIVDYLHALASRRGGL